MENTRLSAKEILDKDFKSSVKGYNKDEVDQFLDLVIQDYETFENRIRDLEESSNGSTSSAAPITSSRESRREHSEETESSSAAGSTNYDILRRLSNLEKEVFGKKLYDENSR